MVGGQRALAQELGVTVQTVNQWVHGKRPIPPMRALAMQKLTGGQVTAASLRPELAEIFSVPDTPKKAA